MNKMFFPAASLAAAMMCVGGALAQSTVYNSVPNPLPPNVTSEGFECCSTAELGDEIALAGSARVAGVFTIVMSNFSRQIDYPGYTNPAGYSVPMTLTLYGQSTGNSPGAAIATVSQTVMIPWRPVGDPTCPPNDYSLGNKWRGSDGECYNGQASLVTFDLRHAGLGGSALTLPSRFIYGLAFNTQSHGKHPTGQPGPYNSLNVGLAEVPPTVGTDFDPLSVFVNADNGYFYADCGLGGVNSYRKNTGYCSDPTNWAGYTPAVKVTTYTFATTKDACKNGGWAYLSRADFTPFKNQGDCVSYTNTGK